MEHGIDGGGDNGKPGNKYHLYSDSDGSQWVYRKHVSDRCSKSCSHREYHGSDGNMLRHEWDINDEWRRQLCVEYRIDGGGDNGKPDDEYDVYGYGDQY